MFYGHGSKSFVTELFGRVGISREVQLCHFGAHFCVSFDKPKQVPEQPGDGKMHILYPG